MKVSIAVLLCGIATVCAAQKVAITFDDLPLNGDLPPGVTRVQIALDTLAVLKARYVPAAYGFINAKKLEGNPDAAEALKLWAAAEPFGNHTYGHMSVQIMLPSDRPRDVNNPVKYDLGGYEAYYGTYEVNEQANSVTHHVQGSLVRALVGKDLTRIYRFSDGQLILKSSRPDEHWTIAWEHY